MIDVTSQRLMTVALFIIVCGLNAAAQGRQGCTVVTLSDPPRDVVRCPGLTFEAERATQYRLIDRNQDGTPEGARVSGGAVLIDVDPSRRGGFQILTLHATAAVRGTNYAVDVQQIQSSVFVAQGRVVCRVGRHESGLCSVRAKGGRRAWASSRGEKLVAPASQSAVRPLWAMRLGRHRQQHSAHLRGSASRGRVGPPPRDEPH